MKFVFTHAADHAALVNPGETGRFDNCVHGTA